MMTRLKRIIVGVGALALAVGGTACAGDDTTTDDGEQVFETNRLGA